MRDKNITKLDDGSRILCQQKHGDKKVKEIEAHKIWGFIRERGYVQWENKNKRGTEKRQSI